MFHPDELHAGHGLTARTLNEFFAELERLGRLAVQAPLTLGDDAGGIRLGATLGEKWWIKLTSAGAGGSVGKYAWTRQTPTSGGGWTNSAGGESGTVSADPAIELSLNGSVNLSPNPVVAAWRDPVSDALLFQAGSC